MHDVCVEANCEHIPWLDVFSTAGWDIKSFGEPVCHRKCSKTDVSKEKCNEIRVTAPSKPMLVIQTLEWSKYLCELL